MNIKQFGAHLADTKLVYHRWAIPNYKFLSFAFVLTKMLPSVHPFAYCGSHRYLWERCKKIM